MHCCCRLNFSSLTYDSCTQGMQLCVGVGSVFRRNMVRVLLPVCTTDEYEKLLACAVRLEGYLTHTEPIPSSVEKRLVSQWVAVLSWAGALECED
jgi:hypothetical protein